jgi:hypothetical protein
MRSDQLPRLTDLSGNPYVFEVHQRILEKKDGFTLLSDVRFWHGEDAKGADELHAASAAVAAGTASVPDRIQSPVAQQLLQSNARLRILEDYPLPDPIL